MGVQSEHSRYTTSLPFFYPSILPFFALVTVFFITTNLCQMTMC
jgi:hypothetical protein